MPFRFTLFNGLTLLVMALTILAIAVRLTRKLDSNLPLVYYGVIAGYWKAFEGGLNTWWILAGAICGLLLRFGIRPRALRVGEFAVFGYILWRSVGLLLLW